MLTNEVETFTKKKTNYIFAFGNIGVGKSTLLAGISNFLIQKTPILFSPHNKEGNRFLFTEWIENLKNNQFPPRSRIGEIIEIDLHINLDNNEDDIMRLTFLEMSGEDLSKIDLRQDKEDIETLFNKYIETSSIFLLITDYDKAQDDDLLMFQFFNLLFNLNANMSNIALIVSKWDLNESNYPLKEFVTEKMPQTFAWLNSKLIQRPKAFSFSIGVTEKDRIMKLDLNNCNKVIKWIYNTLIM